jgi:two-component system, cell cycle sensor histidine kinase and response regulator CckA
VNPGIEATDEVYRRIVEAVPEGIWTVDTQGRTIFCNERMAEILGTDMESMPELSCFETVFPEDLAEAQRQFAVHMADDAPPFDFRLRRKDGSALWVSISCKPFHDDVGAAIGLLGLFTEITARRQSEQQRSLLAAIVESSDDAIISETPEGIILSWNTGAEKLYGYGAEEMTGRSISLLVPPDRPDEIPKILERIRRGERIEHYETQHVRKDKCRIEVSLTISPIRDGTGTIIGASAIARDITKRKESEAALRESEERFRRIADSAPVMIFASGPDQLANFFSKGWLDFTGRKLEQELDFGWTEGLHPEDRGAALAAISSSFAAHDGCNIEYRLRRADGEYRWLLCRGIPRFGRGGDFEGYIGSAIDITDARRAQEEALARQKLESLGILAGGIAHDFNNLLGCVLAEAELLEAELPVGSAPGGEIQRIKAASIRGSEIVRELMIYAGKDSPSLRRPVDLSRLVNEMLELLKISAPKRVALKIELDDNLPATLGSASQIRQVVMNLVINASEAVGETGGEIRISTSRVIRGQGDADDLPAGDYVRLEVSDTGPGMTEEVRAKIFDPFYSTKFAGRGLGLALVQRIVRDHGGAIEAVSAPGQGTTFHVLLPCSSGRALGNSDVVTPRRAEQSSVRTGTILVVEDEEGLRHAVSRALRKNGYSLLESSDGSAAIDLLRRMKDEIDVILLDVTLPGTSSREVFEEAMRVRPNIKIVLTSAYSEKTVHASFAGLQVTHFIRKPFGLAELRDTIRDAMAS